MIIKTKFKPGDLVEIDSTNSYDDVIRDWHGNEVAIDSVVAEISRLDETINYWVSLPDGTSILIDEDDNILI